MSVRVLILFVLCSGTCSQLSHAALTITPASTTFYVGVGGSINLTCSASNVTNSTNLTWTHDGSQISSSGAGVSTVSLTQANLAVGSSGSYQCVLKNATGSVLNSKQIMLVVYGLTISSTSQTHKKGDSATITCTINHDTQVNVTWKKDDIDTSSAVDTFASGTTTSTLTVSYTTASEMYKTFNTSCITSNNNRICLSKYSCSATLNTNNSTETLQGHTNISVTIALPQKPSPPAAQGVTSTEATVTWENAVLGDANLVSYTLEYKKLTDAAFTTISAASSNKTVLQNLTSFTQYQAKMKLVTDLPITEFSDVIQFNTSEDVPSQAPGGVTVKNMSSDPTVLNISWSKIPQEHIHGILVGYRIYYNTSDGTVLSKTVAGPDTTSTQLTGLQKYTTYSVRVVGYTSIGDGKSSQTVDERTAESVPSIAPSHVSVSNITSNTTVLNVSWSKIPQEYVHGILIGYKVYYKMPADQNYTAVDVDANLTEVQLTALQKYTVYSVRVAGYTSVGVGVLSVPVEERTAESVPSKAPVLTAVSHVNGEPTVLKVDWTNISAEFRHGVLLGYKVFYNKTVDSPQFKEINNPADLTTQLTSLDIYTVYSVQVAGFTAAGTGVRSEFKTIRTPASAPPKPDPIPGIQDVTYSTAAMNLQEFQDKNGPVQYYQVIVVRLPHADKPDDSFPLQDLLHYNEVNGKLNKPYIAAEFPRDQFETYKTFKIGKEEKTSKDQSSKEYYNGPLKDASHYAAIQRAYVSDNLYTDGPWSDAFTTSPKPAPRGGGGSNAGAIAAGVLAVLAVGVIIVFFFLWRRMKPRSRPDREKTLEEIQPLPPTPATTPIPTDEFEEHFESMQANSGYLFSQEFQSLDHEVPYTWENTVSPSNAGKNRYNNIVAYDHSRIHLEQIPGQAGSDYINANYINGYCKEKEFIAAQGPLQATEGDFWRMVWEHDVRTVVMLTNLEERGREKCSHYWPATGTKTYHGIHITLEDTNPMSYYTVRQFELKKDGQSVPRTIKQFHFTAWPDYGVPESVTPVLSFLRKVMTSNAEHGGPIVAHCSAGVGRTGTLLAIEAQLKRIADEGTVDIYGYVSQMRTQRNMMVQTEEQYIFIHRAILEVLASGDTEIQAPHLKEKIKKLMEVDEDSGQTDLDREFSRLSQGVQRPSNFSEANKPYNKNKNRYANILPYDDSRVRLCVLPGVDGSDYINANFIDGYLRACAFIATQAPIPDTIPDFWRMVWEQNSAVIVMLSNEVEGNRQRVHRYWPKSAPLQIVDLIVEKTEERAYDDYILRVFKLTHTKISNTRVIRQYQYTAWPVTGIPASGAGMIDLIGQVERWQQQSGNTTIVVHCSAGCGRSGVFCALSFLIDRVKTEGVIDVFQTVKQLRQQRTAMVQTKDQYEFLYFTLQEYLDSFDHYNNFT